MPFSQERELTTLFSDTGEDYTTQFLHDQDPKWSLPTAPRSRPFESIDRTARFPSATLSSSPTSSHTLATSSTVSQYTVAHFALIDLPVEVRTKIYHYLVSDPSIKHCLAHDHLDVFKVTRITHICQALRDEYLAYLLSNFAFKKNLDWLPRFVSTFGKLLYIIKTSLVIFYNPSVADTPMDILPVLELEAKMPKLSFRFESLDSQLPFDVTLTRDFNHLLDTCRDDPELADYIKDCVLSSLEFHSEDHLQRRYPKSRLNSRIQIRFKRGYKKLWMDGTRSFDELQCFLSATGLDLFTSLDVWVGIASMSAQGKGLRPRFKLQEPEQLLDRDTEVLL